jgi:tetratricopeptide (TPR) repeat protein
VEQAMRLDPRSPQLGVFLSVMGRARLFLREAQAALDCFARAQMDRPSFPNIHAGTAMAHAILGDLDAARAATKQVLELVPTFRMSRSAYSPLSLSPDLYLKMYDEIILPAAIQAGLPA